MACAYTMFVGLTLLSTMNLFAQRANETTS